MGIDLLVFILNMFNCMSVCRHATHSTDSLTFTVVTCMENCLSCDICLHILHSLHISLDVVYTRAEWKMVSARSLECHDHS